MKAIYGFCCEQGMGRITCQDRVFFRRHNIKGLNIYAIAACDGVGQLEGSSVASQLVSDFMDDWFNTNVLSITPTPAIFCNNAQLVLEDLQYGLLEVLWAAHQHIVDACISAATTVCSMLVVNNLYCIFSSGDSRIYEIGRSVRQLTEDQIVEHNGITTLKHCLGCSAGPNFARIDGKIRKGSTYLLVTDGFYRKLNYSDAALLFNKCRSFDDIAAIVHSLREYVLSEHESDDMSCVAIKFI